MLLKFHTFESQYWLKQCVTSSTLSRMSCATHLIRNSESVVKTTFKMLRLKSLSGISSFSQSSLCSQWSPFALTHAWRRVHHCLTALPCRFILCVRWKLAAGYKVSTVAHIRYTVAEWYCAGLCNCEVAGSTRARGRGCCVPMPTRRAIPPGSVNEHQRKLGSKLAYQCTMPHDELAPYPWSCSFGWCPAEGYRKRRSAPPHGPLRLGKGLFTVAWAIDIVSVLLLILNAILVN